MLPLAHSGVMEQLYSTEAAWNQQTMGLKRGWARALSHIKSWSEWCVGFSLKCMQIVQSEAGEALLTWTQI